MYIMADFTVGTMGDLIGFEGCGQARASLALSLHRSSANCTQFN